MPTGEQPIQSNPAVAVRRPWWRRYRVVIWLAVTLGALDALIAANAVRWTAYDPHPYRERLARCRQQRWDLVIAGGSPAMCGVDPAALIGATWRGGDLRSAYNLGLPLATATEVCLAVEHTVASPRLLIYCVSATDLNDSRLESHGPRQIMSAGDVVRWAADRPRDAGWCVRGFLAERVNSLWQLYRYRGGLRLWAANCANQWWPGCCDETAAAARVGLAISSDLRTGDGYRAAPAETPAARFDHRKAAGEHFDQLLFMEPFRIGGGQLTYLRHLLHWTVEHDVPIVLVDLPVTADLDERLYHREFADYRATLAAAARDWHVPLWQPSRAETGLTDADFSDLIHLNAQGAARLSRWLRATLRNGDSTAVAAGSVP
jgi:hypothetical protein